MSTPAGPPGGGLPNPNTLSCTSSACQTALSTIVDDGNNIIMKCGQISAAQGWVNALLAIIGAILSAVAALLAALVKAIGIAGIIGLFLGLDVITATGLDKLMFFAVLVLLSIVLTLLTIIAGIEIYILVLTAQLSSLKNKFLTDVTAVKMSCPPTCWGDLRVPGC